MKSPTGLSGTARTQLGKNVDGRRPQRSVVHVNDCSQVASLLTKGLAEAGWSAHLAQPRLRPFHGTGPRGGLRNSRLMLAADRSRFALTLRSSSPDLLHIHYGMFGAMGILARTPFVLHFHGGDLLNDENHLIYSQIHHFAARKAAACFVSTPDLLAFNDRFRDRLQFLPNPVVLPAPQEVVPGRVLFSAKLDNRKDPETFLSAARILAARGVKVRLLGFGNDSKRFGANLASIQTAGGTVLRSRLPHDTFASELAQAEVVVGQFGVGAFGMTELKAFAFGRPVVTHFVFPNAYNRAPAYVEAHHPVEIAEAVLRLLENREAAREIGSQGRHWVSREHGIEPVTARLISEYERILS